MKAGRRFSPVESLKDIVGFVVGSLKNNDLEAVITAKRRTVECYLAFKWTLVAGLWLGGWRHWVSIVIVVYLLIFNLHSYVDHHLWNPIGDMNPVRLKRRFVSLLQGIAFNAFGFAYLYGFHLSPYFKGDSFSLNNPVVAIAYSILNTLGSGGNIAKPETVLALIVTTAQVITTFIFVGLLLSKTSTENGD